MMEAGEEEQTVQERRQLGGQHRLQVQRLPCRQEMPQSNLGPRPFLVLDEQRVRL